MEPQVIGTLANSSNLAFMMMLCAGPLIGLIILVMSYKIIHKFVPDFIKAVNDISEQTKLMRELLHELRKDLDDVQKELKDIKVITADNRRRDF